MKWILSCRRGDVEIHGNLNGFLDSEDVADRIDGRPNYYVGGAI